MYALLAIVSVASATVLAIEGYIESHNGVEKAQTMTLMKECDNRIKHQRQLMIDYAYENNIDDIKYGVKNDKILEAYFYDLQNLQEKLNILSEKYKCYT